MIYLLVFSEILGMMWFIVLIRWKCVFLKCSWGYLFMSEEVSECSLVNILMLVKLLLIMMMVSRWLCLGLVGSEVVLLKFDMILLWMVMVFLIVLSLIVLLVMLGIGNVCEMVFVVMMIWLYVNL